MIQRKASCSCGQLTVTARGEPIRVSVCHCWACQKRTGSAFGAQVRFPIDVVSIEGKSKVFERVGDADGKASFHFCERCGGTVYYYVDAMPDVVAIALGAFARHDFPPPAYSVYEARRHPWVELSNIPERWE